MNNINLYHPNDGKYRIWNYDNIYKGEDEYIDQNRGGSVPNVGDLIHRFIDDKIIYYRVVSVDDITLESLLEIVIPSTSGTISGDGTTLVSGLDGTLNSNYIGYTYINNNRYTFNIDSRIYVTGNNISEFKLFLNSDISSETGVILSIEYDVNGNVIGDSFDVVLVSNTRLEMDVYKPASGFVNRKLNSGDICTLVGYDSSGGILMKQKIIVDYTPLTNNITDEIKYITDMFIDPSFPYISPTNSDILEIPSNLLNTSFNIPVRITYNNGSSKVIDINDNGLSILGLEMVHGEWVGQQRDIVISYVLLNNERASNVGISNNIAKTYQVNTIESIRDEDYKLYILPLFINGEYTLKTYLLNLKGNLFLDVSGYVDYEGTFNSSRFDISQNVIVKLNPSVIDDTIYPDLIITQSQVITLLEETPSIDNTPFFIDYTKGLSSTQYGSNVQGVFGTEPDNRVNINLNNNISTREEWLDVYYRTLDPQYNLSTVPGGLVDPERVRLLIDDDEFIMDIDIYWNNTFILDSSPRLSGSNITLVWERTDEFGETLTLAVSNIFSFYRII